MPCESTPRRSVSTIISAVVAAWAWDIPHAVNTDSSCCRIWRAGTRMLPPGAGAAAHFRQDLAAEQLDAGQDVGLRHARPAHPHGEVRGAGLVLGEQHAGHLGGR